MPYETITVTPISPVIGAGISGIDLRQPLGNQAFAEIHRALLEHLVIFFRDQDIDWEQHKAFGRRFGELHIHPFIPSLEGYNEIIQLKAKSGANDNLRLANQWHPDLSYTPDPPLAAILRGVTVPSRGGDTMWVNLYKAYETLSEPMKEFISGLSAYHDVTKTYRLQDLQTKGGAERFWATFQKSPPMLQPLVQAHPETGRKLLYISELTTTYIEGLNPAESDAIIKMLIDHLNWKELQCRFFWQPKISPAWHFQLPDHEIHAFLQGH